MTSYDFTPQQTVDVEAAPDTFEYFGERFEIPRTVGSGSVLRFTWLIKEAEGLSKRGDAARRKALTEEGLAAASSMEAQAEINAQAAVYNLLNAVLGEHQIGRLLDTVDRNGVEPEGLMELSDQIQQVIAGRPTKRSAVSSAGPSTNGVHSTAAGYYDTVIVEPTEADPEPLVRKGPPRKPSAPTRPTSTPPTETPLILTPMQQQMAVISAASQPVH